jgi:hypothetical protein
MRRMNRATTVIIALLAATVPAAAHHGFGTFDLSKTVSFPGAKLTKLELINPHSWLYFETTDANGKVTKHRCEMRSVHTLRRSGWTRELFPINSKIDITASPDRLDPQSCYLQTIVFANGARMDRYGQYVKAPEGGVKEVRGAIRTANTANRPARRPTGEPNLAGDWAPEQVVMADPRGVGGGLVPLSTLATAETAPAARRGGGGGAAAGGRGRGAAAGPRQYGGTEVTPHGEAVAAKLTQQDNPRFKCLTTSILFDWTFDGPVNRISQSKDTITIEYGQMDLKRTVHMNMKTHPANVKRTRAGHSIGRWEGDTLVVDTVGFLPGVLNFPVSHGEKLHVVERFTLDPATLVLTREWEAEDPDYLKGKATGRDRISPADAPFAKDDCKELGFIDYSKQAR